MGYRCYDEWDSYAYGGNVKIFIIIMGIIWAIIFGMQNFIIDYIEYLDWKKGLKFYREYGKYYVYEKSGKLYCSFVSINGEWYKTSEEKGESAEEVKELSKELWAIV